MRFFPSRLKLRSPSSRPGLASEARGTVALAFPLVAGQLSQMLIGLADTVMIGRLGVTPLAASTFANTLLYPPFVFGLGMTLAISVRVSQARGAGDPGAARAALRHGLYLALACGVATFLLAVGLLPLLPWFRQPPEVTAEAGVYFLLVAASYLPALGALALKGHADAMNHPWPAFWIMLGGVLLNVLLNGVFIYGWMGGPELGLEGAGVATVLARLAAFAALLAWCRRSRSLAGWVPRRWLRRPSWPALRGLAAIGLPTSLHLLAEMSAFVFATLLIGTLGETALASHQVAITCAATIFMVPLGISMALTVRAGEAFGSRQRERLRSILRGGWLLAALFTAASAAFFLAGNRMIAGWFIAEPEARALAASLLLIAAAFQFSDAMQIVSSGVLRGLGDVNAAAWTALGAYWVISIPAGWLLAFPGKFGAAGVWWGITIGLTLAALVLGARAWRLTRADRIWPGDGDNLPGAGAE